MKQHMAGLQKASASHRHQLAALKRQLSETEKALTSLRKAARSAIPAKPVADGKKIRFAAKGLKPLRTRLGVSAKDFGLLVGATEQAVYNWETRKSVPRAAQVEKIAALRGIGKREARARLESLMQSADRKAGKSRT